MEASVLVSLVGSVCVSLVRDPLRAWRLGLFFMGGALGCAVIAGFGFYAARAMGESDGSSLQPFCFGRTVFRLDELNAPLLPLVALLHFLTALATGRTRMRLFSLTWSLAAEGIKLATVACLAPWVLVGLLVAGAVPAFAELRNRGASTRVYLLHMGLFALFAVVGWAGIATAAGSETQVAWASALLLAAILIRCGVVPVHCWLTDWFEHASFGNALLFVTPLTGVYAALRLVLPVAPDWVLQIIGLASLITALYAAGMTVVQKDARRFFAYLFLSQASLVLVGLELHTSTSLTGSLALWISASLSLAGLGLTLRALEARFGELSLTRFHGLYSQSPALAVCFLLTGLASVGFPGTLGFVGAELLVEGTVEASLLIGIGVTIALSINGIAIVRAYFLLFTGARHVSTVSLGINPRERFAVLTLAVLILGGGLVPQPGIRSRFMAAETIVKEREAGQAADAATALLK
jgi:NADH-quinone oxidoreductase subunit M